MAFAKNPFPGSAPDWRWIRESTDRDDWLWCQRHGHSAYRDNPDFWNFLVLGVGLAPVVEFCLLITLFVLLIGPLNYVLLRRWGKLHLLVLTVPGCAGVVTFALFGYALVADGLATRVRARSITEIDQREGRAVCWTRLSYYAGLSPRGGLRFPDDVAVLPLEQSPLTDYDSRPAVHEVAWDEDQQLTAGWIASRTPTQFLTRRSRKSDYGLDLLPAAGDGPPSVRNRLAGTVEQLLVRTADNRYYWASQVAWDATAVLEPITPGEAYARLRQAYHMAQPSWPPGINTPIRKSGGRRMYRYYMWNDTNLIRPAQDSGCLENWLKRLAAESEEDIPLLAPGGYVAVVDRSPEVALGVSEPKEEGGYHVILGKW